MSDIGDREILGAVRWAVEKDPRIKSAELIHLSVEKGIVQLWGNVDSAAEKAAAEAVARAQPGTKDVVNALTVVMATPALSERQALREAVVEALANGRGVRSRDVGVDSVDRGVVRLVGQVRSVAEERAAIEAVARIPGVREVVSTIMIGEVAPEEALEIFDDSTIKSLVNSAMAERGVTIFEEDTTVTGGIVTLRGRVVNPREVSLAEEAAAAVAGVNDVVNQLDVDHALTSRDPDEALAARVIRALQRDGRVSPAQVQVQCVAGDVHLFGYVESIDDQNAAAAVARRVQGVRNVINDVQITDRTSLGLMEKQQGSEAEGRR